MMPCPASLQGARYSIPYFVNPRLNYVIEGPEKRFSPVTGFDLLSKTGNAYAARKNGAVKLPFCHMISVHSTSCTCSMQPTA